MQAASGAKSGEKDDSDKSEFYFTYMLKPGYCGFEVSLEN